MSVFSTPHSRVDFENQLSLNGEVEVAMPNVVLNSVSKNLSSIYILHKYEIIVYKI